MQVTREASLAGDRRARPSRDPLLVILTSFALVAAGFAWVVGWNASRPAQSSAAMLLHEEISRVDEDIRRVTRPGIIRGRAIAGSPVTRRALRSGDRAQLTTVCNDAITDATEIDAIALFDASGDIVAINTLRADWTEIEPREVDRVLGLSFDRRDIVRVCVREPSRDGVVEFQTACDITPAFFDSSGLSIAHSIAVSADDGTLLGVVSTRMRFDRLSDVVRDRMIDGQEGRFHFVTESGSFLDEAVNAGGEPPIPGQVVQSALSSSADSNDGISIVLQDDHAIALCRFDEYVTVGEGGVIAMVAVPRTWFDARVRSDVASAVLVPLGFLMVFVVGVIVRHSLLKLRAVARRTQDVATRLDQLISQSPAAIAMLDRDLRYVAASDGWYREYDLPRTSLEGQCHYDVFPTMPDRWRAIHQRVLAGETVESERDMFTDENGRRIWVRYKVCPWIGRAGEVRGLIMFTEVINDQVAHESELEHARDEAVRANGDIKALRNALDEYAIMSVAGRDGRIIDVNTAFCRVAGYERDELIGQDHRLLNSGCHPRGFWVDVWRTIASGRAWRGEVCNRRKDGDLYWVDSTIVPHLGDDGKPDRYISIRFDITEKKRVEAELGEAIRRAEEASAAKSQFLANMSHEIRTPMTAILGYADLLTSGEEVQDDPSHSAQLASSIQSNSKHLLSVINDILDVSKIEAGQMTVERISTDPVEVVEEVASLMRPAAVEKGLFLDVRYETTIPESIVSDPTRLRQILINITSNAVKFTSDGGVTINVACDQAAGVLILRIVDTGEGMTPAQRDEIARFEAFTQADPSMSRRFGGTGLGLRISNALAVMLGGSIEIESTDGEGSTFTVSVAIGDVAGVKMLEPDEIMPVKAASGEPLERATPENPAALPLRGVRVLLAEDGVDNQRLISFHLRKAGAEVMVCENGRIACDAILEPPDGSRPDVVLMDMQMPEMDGYSATRRLRAEAIDIPIIALTAHAMAGDRDKCLDAGCTDYLTKPIDKVLLVETCRRFAASRDQEDRRGQAA